MPDPLNPIVSAASSTRRTEQVREVQQMADVVRAVQFLNSNVVNMQETGTRYSLSIDSATRRPVIRLLDKTTGRTLYQIPPEELLRIAAELRRKQQAPGQCGGAAKDS